MKVCMLSSSFPRNASDDAGIFIARLVEALSAIGVMGMVIAPSDRQCRDDIRIDNWEIQRVRYHFCGKSTLAYGSGMLPNLKANPLLAIQIPLLLAAFFMAALKYAKKSDILHANWIVSGIPAVLAGLFISKPVIVTVRGEDLKLLHLPFVGRILRYLLSFAAAITTVSDDFYNQLKILFPGKKIYSIPNGVRRVDCSPERLEEIKKSFQLEDYVIFAGRLIALKRIELLIEIFSKLGNQNLKLVLCGALNDTGYVSKLKNIALELGIQDRLIFAGQVDPSSYLQLLSGASQYWTASEYEGRPNGVLEALAHGIPCIASDIPAHRSLVSSGYSGFLFNENTISEITGQIENLLSDNSLRNKLSANAKDSVAGSDWKVTAVKYSDVYQDVAS